MKYNKQNKLRKKYLLLTIFVLIGLLPFNVFAVSNDSIEGTENSYQEIIPLSGPCCANANVTATGHMGHVTPANTPALGLNIPGAPWEFCDSCGTITIGGGGIQTPNNTNTLSQNPFPEAIRPYIQRVVFTEPITAGSSLHDLFHGLTNLTEIVGINYIDTTATQNMRRMFFRTYSLVGLDLSSFNTCSATNKYRMFADTGAQTLNLGGLFNTGGLVTNYGSMFWGASNLTSIGDTSAWNTSSATRMSRMFQDTHNLAHLNTSGWDTSSVTLMYNMFHNTHSLTSLDLTGWDVSHVTRMDVMFSGASGLTGLDLSTWYTPSLGRMDNMFDGTSGLTYLHLNNFYTANVINRNNSFRGLTSLRVLTLGTDWYWNAFNGTGLPNPPNNSYYNGLWQNVANGTIAAPRGEFYQTAVELFDNGLHPNGIANVWVWSPRFPPRLVLFEGENGTVAPNTSVAVGGTPSGTIGDELVITKTPNTNYEFSHWISDQHTGEFTTDEIRSLPITEDTTFTAIFVPATHTVTFVLNGGSGDFPPQTVAHGETPTEPSATPAPPSGYIFGGWFTAAIGGIAFSFDDPIFNDTQVYARWIPTATLPPLPLTFIKADSRLYENPNDPIIPLNGAEFRLYRQTATGWEVVATEVSGGTAVPDGQVTLEFSAFGTYRLEEIVAPHGYERPTGYWSITWSLQADADPLAPNSWIPLITPAMGNQPFVPINISTDNEEADYVWHVGNERKLRFSFHKTDQRLYAQIALGEEADWNEINTFLLPGAQFTLYRWNDTNTAPSYSNELVRSDNSGSEESWTYVASDESSGSAENPIVFNLDRSYKYFQLVETKPPTGFEMPRGQWRLILEYDVDFSDSANQNLGWQELEDNWWLRIVAIGDPSLPTFIRQPADNYVNNVPILGSGEWYLGNNPHSDLPLLGMKGKTLFMLSGVAFISLAAGILIYQRQHLLRAD